MMELKGSSGKKYNIDSTPFAGGGEGNIHDIIGERGYVAKLYKADMLTTERERKLLVMAKNQPSTMEQYAWPTDILYQNGHFAGFVMPRISGREKLNNIYVYDKRVGKPWSLYVTIACNLASAVNNVHEIDQVIGDLNPDNILADPIRGYVTLVDTDSYHISDGKRIYRCGVGRPEYVPPELQNVNFAASSLPTFSKESDRFALAVLIFALLMNGNHPYSCVASKSSGSAFQQQDNIKKCKCAFFPESGAGMQIPPSAPEMTSLPRNIQDLFHRAFIGGHKHPYLRPTAEEWYYALEQLKRNLTRCSKNSGHWYFQDSRICPWCDVDQRMAAAWGGSKSSAGSGKASGSSSAGHAGGKGGTGSAGKVNVLDAIRKTISGVIQGILDFFFTIYDFIEDKLEEYGEWIVGSLLVIAVGFVLIVGGRALVRGVKKVFHKNPTEVAASAEPGGSQTGDIPVAAGSETETDSAGIDLPEETQEGGSGAEAGSETGADDAGIDLPEETQEGGSGAEAGSETETDDAGIDLTEETQEDGSDTAADAETEEILADGSREVESNNTRETANKIMVNAQYTGALSAKRYSEQDWYTFTLDQPGKVSFTLFTKRTGLHLFSNPIYWKAQISFGYENTDLIEYVRWNESSKETHSAEKELAAGTYFFLILSGPKKFCKEDYSFIIHYTPIEAADQELESNDE